MVVGEKQRNSDEANVMIEQPGTSINSSSLTRERLIAICAILLGIIFLIVGIVLIAVSSKAKSCPDSDKTSVFPQDRDSTCEPSQEASRVGLLDFFDKVKNAYYEYHPHNAPYHPDISGLQDYGLAYVQQSFSAYDSRPMVIKQRTDKALLLLEEINNVQVDEDRLKPRERKALQQIKHYLKHVFGQPYDVNFYAGDWMLGPNLFCWQPICYLGYDVYNALYYFKPFNLSDVEVIEMKLKSHEDAVKSYVNNMKMGVRKGMVRSAEECRAGLDAIKRKFLNTSRYNETGVLLEWFAKPVVSPSYYSNITKRMNEEWKRAHMGMNVSESVKQYFVDYIGKPIVSLLRYLEHEHLRHCVPSSVASGLGRLPVKYVYTDGVANLSHPTDPTLPITGGKLDGKKAYEMIMTYFTTNDMTPNEVHNLGLQMLEKLYPMAVAVALEVTGESDNATAVAKFREILNSTESYFNDPIPANESDANAHRLCSDIKGAQKYCPVRWDAIQQWFREARKVMSMLDPKTVEMFYFTGPKHTTPNCPIDMSPDLNPSSGAQSYDSSGKSCLNSAKYNIPFFLGRMGPKFSEWSVNAHESRPGHHLQVQGKIEHFQDTCGGSIGWLNSETYYTAFTEGWGLYAENPLIAEDTDTYKDNPMQRFGMLKWQLWRAIRLIVDTGLHYKGFSRAEALKYFDEKAWDGTDLAEKEVTRYQSDPGQATAYMIGQLDIKKSRQYAIEQLGDAFDLKDFHYQVLKQGSSPLAYLSDHIKRYVACRKDPKKVGCDAVLLPPKKSSSSQEENVVKKRLPFPIARPHKRHYI
ncbi:uncharacterized protein LOC5511190 [Nematostella vectensis]|uniref:uncharacterized protein LOC5511190 n=1 Tax=Nematostella vectensis TaxID=45351 RepID=UPI0020770CD3|nr:uncharacterized protein LOC5511190 [Nematostella vectensis]XP_048584058.1 uncharacterized protein LOC5511190 [Nematostella vectensis]